MAGPEQEAKQPDRGKSLGERLRDFVDSLVDELKALVDPPRPVRVPVTAGGRRPR